MKKTRNKILLILMLSLIMCSMFAVSAFAAETGDVAGAVEDTWNAAKGQIKQVVNNVVFPIHNVTIGVKHFIKFCCISFIC